MAATAGNKEGREWQDMMRITDQDVTRVFKNDEPVDAVSSLQRAFRYTQTHAVTNVEEEKNIARAALRA